MKKRMIIMLILVAIVFSGIFIYKAIMNHLLKAYMANQSNLVYVSTMKARTSPWQPKLTAVGSTRAIRGVNVTTELAGLVEKIYFTPGTFVKEGTVLVQLNAASDLGLLHSLQANEELAHIVYRRDSAQYAIRAISKAALDTDLGNLKSLIAQVAQQAATVDKKTIRAPFTGRLGVSAVNPGQFLNAGDMVVTLQTLNPIWVNFFVPQQALAKLKLGQPVSVTTDSFPGKTFTGTITTINPLVDVNTRNIEVEATVANPHYEIIPGMFVSVAVNTGKSQTYITLPQTAVSFNPYGELVYVVKKSGSDKKGNPILTAHQIFVSTGETRGDQIAILQGLHGGETIVTSGQLKLKNGSEIAINNSIAPANNPTPKVPNPN
jgi:membrane fusion protein (multidrug efflux system)